jgi:transposase InsO family protein
LKTKSEVLTVYKRPKAWVRTGMSRPIKVLHTDRGGEYMSNNFHTHLTDAGTEHHLTVYDTPEQNGITERLNLTLMDKVRAMLYDSGLSQMLWGEAVMHAVWLKNRMSTRVLRDTTPYEARTGMKPDLSSLCEFGCKAYVWAPGDKIGL